MSEPQALILGGGPAGLACACLLRARGWQVDLVAAAPAHEPVLALNEVTVGLLRELCGLDVEQVACAHPVARRLVRWDTDRPMVMPQRTLSLPLRALREALHGRAVRAGARLLDEAPADDAGHAWVIDARGRRSPQAGGVLRFGGRFAQAVVVPLAGPPADDACVLEAVDGGWLFLLPQGHGQAVLQGVAASADAGAEDTLPSLLQASRLIRPRVGEVGGDPVRFDAMPRLGLAPAREGHLSIGDAALAFDPLSGDGLGCGLRSALLACAVVQAIREGDDPQACLDHYAARLARAAGDHVRQCLSLYESVRGAPHWAAEVDAMRAGLSRCPQGPARFDRVLDRQGLRPAAVPTF